MKPSDLYKRTPERIDNNINHLVDHLPELPDFYWIEEEKVPRVEILYYKDFCFDGRRVWILASVKFDGKFVMVTQNAGREGDDYVKRFITNRPLYNTLVEYIRTLTRAVSEDISKCDEVSINKDTCGLTCFYGSYLDDEFRRH